MMKNFKKTHSIQFKVFMLVVFALLMMGVTLLGNLTREINAEVGILTDEYMLDMAKSSGYLLDAIKDYKGSEVVTRPDVIEAVVKDIHIAGIESCYAYVVDAKGYMLYHPDSTKIGLPVENAAITQIVNDLSKGKIPESKVIEYNYRGVDKLASYYINSDATFIVIITVDSVDANRALWNIIDFGIKAIACLIVILGFMAVFAVRAMTKPILLVNDNIQQLAALDFREDENINKLIKKKDEIGDIAKSVMSLRSNMVNILSELRAYILNITEASNFVQLESNRVSNITQQMEKAVSEISQGATSQAQETSVASENVILIGNKVKETETEVINLKTVATGVKQASDNAITAIVTLSSVNNDTKASVDEIYKQTVATNEAVNSIKEAVSVITSIAAQTNLLSLNASIEAARAGDVGKGFAVVADEIKKLAEQSATSAGQIDEIINRLIIESDKSVVLMNDVQKNYIRQSESVENTQYAFSEIKSNIDEAMNSIELVKTKTESLDKARCNVIDIVQNLTAIAEENAAGAQETAASVVEVANAMEGMKQESSALFKIAEGLRNAINKIVI